MAVRPLRITVLADARQARKELTGFGSRLKGMLGGAAAFAGGAGIAAGLRKVVTEASNAQQSLGATEAIFGRFSKSVIDNSEKAADAVGLSANSYRESSNLLGALFKNQGVQLRRLSGETDKHIGLAADLSAMYGGPVTDAVDALTAAYKGEFNQLEKYGVTLKASTISTQADAIAKKKYGKALNDLAPAQENLVKQLATQRLLFKQTGDATGTFAREADTLAGQQQRLKAELDNVAAEIGTALLPMLTDLAQWARDDVVPALEDFARWLSDNQDEITSTAHSIGDELLPPLKELSGLVIDAVQAFSDLPGPVKEMAFQVGLAAYALPKLNAAMTLTSTGLLNFTTRARTAATSTAALSRGLTTAAGVGGMIALQQGAQRSNEALTILGGTLTGAALGASAGSVFPGVGTAIGAIGGAAIGSAASVYTLSKRTEFFAQITPNARKAAQDYAASLDAVTGAATRQTRELILASAQQSGILTLTNRLGVANRDVIGAVLGNEGATRRLSQAYRENSQALDGPEQADFNTWLAKNTTALQRQAAEVRQNNTDTKSWKQVLKGLPPKLQVEIKQLGASASIKEVRRLARQYEMQPKRLLTRLELAGVEVTGRNLRAVQRELKETGNTKPGNRWLDLFVGDLDLGKRQAGKGAQGMSQALREGTGKARPNLGPFNNAFRSDLSGLLTLSGSRGNAIGSDLGAGINSGIGGWIGTIARTAAAAVNAAEAAARAAADSHSPSRVFMRVGSDMGEGMVVGMRRKQGDTEQAGRFLSRSALKGLKNGTDGIRDVLDKFTKEISKALDKRYDGKALKRHTRLVLKGLKDEYAHLLKNGKRQDAINQKLETAREKLKGLKEEQRSYAESIKAAALGYASITNLDSAFTPTAITAALQGRLEKLRQFAAIIADLRAQKLNQTTLDQLLQGGVEGGLAYALAIQQGGADAVKEINDLQAQIGQVAGNLGDTAASNMYDAGIKAAEGLVKGLESQAANLDKWARRIAQNLIKAIKRELGIKSPSRVFMGIGDNVVKGLQIGLDDTYVKRSGAVLAASLQKGFGTPALEAYASQNATQTTSGNTYQVTVNVAPGGDLVEAGRQMTKAIDAYEKSGGRRRA